MLPPPRTIKTAILNFDEYALNKEGIEVREQAVWDVESRDPERTSHSAVRFASLNDAPRNPNQSHLTHLDFVLLLHAD